MVLSKPPASPGVAASAVHVRQLTKCFGAKVALDAVSLSVQPGTTYGLIGPNGAGKTTFFSLVAGYLRPTRGSVEILGHSPTATDFLRGRIGILPQDAMLPSDESVGAFLTHLARLQGLPRRRAITAAYDALADVDGKAWWRQRCASLSHGMAKRVALAQAFLGAPDIVLLDEPTAGLDPRIASEVRQLIASKRGTATIVISSHNLPELEQLCDAAAILDRGRVAAQGTMATLTAANEEVRIWVGAGTPLAADAGAVPAAALRDLPAVRSAHFDDDARLLTVSFDPSQADAETVIGRVLTTLLAHGVRISGVAKGRGLEQRVMDLT